MATTSPCGEMQHAFKNATRGARNATGAASDQDGTRGAAERQGNQARPRRKHTLRTHTAAGPSLPSPHGSATSAAAMRTSMLNERRRRASATAPAAAERRWLARAARPACCSSLSSEAPPPPPPPLPLPDRAGRSSSPFPLVTPVPASPAAAAAASAATACCCAAFSGSSRKASAQNAEGAVLAWEAHSRASSMLGTCWGGRPHACREGQAGAGKGPGGEQAPGGRR